MPQQTNRIEELDEILSSPPGGFLRSGSVVITVIIMLFSSLAFIIRYPDKAISNGTITTAKPPIILNAPVSGELIGLAKKDGERVLKNEVLATFKSNTDTAALDYAFKMAQQIKRKMTDDIFILSINADTALLLGDLREPYQNMIGNYLEYENLQSTRIYEQRLSNVSSNISMLGKSNETALRQLKTTEKEFKNIEINFNADKILFDKKAISKMDFLASENEYLAAQKNLEAARENINISQIQLENSMKNKMELDFEYTEKMRLLKENIYTGISTIEDFRNTLLLKYSLVAPTNGVIYYLSKAENNRYFQGNKPMFYILPDNEELIFSGGIPAAGLGKIKKGNRVLLELSDYPAEEFGFLEGTILNISSLPQDSLYRIEVKLPKTLKTDTGKEITFKPELMATAKIFTKEYSLADRFLMVVLGHRN